MKGKLYEDDDINVYDEDVKESSDKYKKKKFCWWIFLISLLGAGFNMYFMPVPGFFLLGLCLILSIVFRKKYKMSPQFIVIALSTALHLFYTYATSLPGVEVTY